AADSTTRVRTDPNGASRAVRTPATSATGRSGTLTFSTVHRGAAASHPISDAAIRAAVSQWSGSPRSRVPSRAPTGESTTWATAPSSRAGTVVASWARPDGTLMLTARPDTP